MMVLCRPCTGGNDSWANLAPFAAFADGPVADTPQPLAAEAGRPITEPDGNHGDAMPHKL